MGDPESVALARNGRRRLLAVLLAGSAGACSTAGAERTLDKATCEANGSNALLWAVAWKQSAAEYFALCHQAYNLARLRLDMAMRERSPRSRPLAVITDMDDTIMHARSYWGHLISEGREFFDDAIWDEWLPENLVTEAPGARRFFRYCEAQDVDVFYVTNRDQGERTFEYALGQLRHLDFPFADEAHLRVFRDTSDKTPARRDVEASHDVALMLGDNLNDYRRDYYVKNVDERMALMERDRDHWGRDFILLPNPTDGHWVRAIFGDSEPVPNAENRRRLIEAATRITWRGTAGE